MMQPEQVILFSCADRFGREIVLYEDTWYDHIDDSGFDRPLRGVVVTAYPVEAIPRREARIW